MSMHNSLKCTVIPLPTCAEQIKNLDLTLNEKLRGYKIVCQKYEEYFNVTFKSIFLMCVAFFVATCSFPKTKPIYACQNL